MRIHNIFKNLLHSSKKKTDNYTEGKRVKDLNKHLTEEETQMASQCKKSCSSPLVTREMQTKTIIQYHSTAAGMAKMKDWQSQVLTRMLRN